MYVYISRYPYACILGDFKGLGMQAKVLWETLKHCGSFPYLYPKKSEQEDQLVTVRCKSLFVYCTYTLAYTELKIQLKRPCWRPPCNLSFELFNSCVTCNLDSLALSAWNKGQPSVLSSATSWQGGYRARSPPSALPEEDPSAACGSPHKKLQWGERSSSWCLASAWSLEMTTEKYFTLEIPRFLVCLLAVCLCF